MGGQCQVTSKHAEPADSITKLEGREQDDQGNTPIDIQIALSVSNTGMRWYRHSPCGLVSYIHADLSVLSLEKGGISLWYSGPELLRDQCLAVRDIFLLEFARNKMPDVV